MMFSQYLTTQRIVKRQANALIRLCVCAGWSEALLVAHTTLLEITCHGSYMYIPIKISQNHLYFLYILHFQCQSLNEPLHLRCRSNRLHKRIALGLAHSGPKSALSNNVVCLLTIA